MALNGSERDVREGQRLRDRRTAAGLTQQELAERAGLSVRAVRNLERGTAGRSRPETVRRVTAALDPAAGPARTADLHIGVLGPLRVELAGRPVELRAPMLRNLLGLLALRPGEVVSQAELVDVLWGDRPPRTCLNLVQGYIVRLRDLLEPRRGRWEPARILVTSAGGYALHPPDPRALDLLAFEAGCATARAAAARGDSTAALAAWADALASWRGAAVADVEPRVRHHPAAVAAGQRRIAATLEFADLAIDVGCADRVVPVLRDLVAAEPLDERLHARLMTCLAASGQRAAALLLFETVRDRLAMELGIPPGTELVAAHDRILRAPAAPPAPQPRPVTEAPLPADVADFVGRRPELAALDRIAAAGRPATVVVTGVGGSGKTALAAHWAHHVAGNFPDGCRYVDLHGYGEQPPMSLDTAVDLLLWSFGQSAHAVPADLDRRLALYRSELAHRRTLIILDNVRTATQVRPLLPGASASVVVVISRSRQESLVVRDSATRIDLDMLTLDDAVDMLRTTGRVAGRSADLARVAELAGRLPLALQIIGCRLAADPAGLGTIVKGLDVDRLAELEIDDVDTGVRAAFDLAYRPLAPAAARLFRLFGLVGVPSLRGPAAGALAGSPAGALPGASPGASVHRPLADLVAANLLNETGGRYEMHDLIREYARQRSELEDPAAERHTAVRRLVDSYLDRAYAAYALLSPRTAAFPPDLVHPPDEPHVFADRAEATAWFQAERATIAALARTCVAHGWSRPAWQLASSMFAFNQSRRRWSDWIELCRDVLDAVRHDGDRLGESRMANVLAVAHKQQGDFVAAEARYEQALHAAEETGDPMVIGPVHVNLGGLYNVSGRFEPAENHLRAALDIAGYGDDPRYGQLLWLNLGHLLFNTGRFAEAADGLRRGLALAGITGDEHTAAYLHHGLGEVAFQREELAEAAGHARAALRLATSTGDPLRRAYALDLLASATMGSDPGRAEAALREAIALCEDLGHPLAEVARDALKRRAPDDWQAEERERRYRVNRLP
ncbi:BTAD domain-containing putative transcriptional regulator [Virgisporangium aurantiacum]|uniref:SARP family transcriptional regulator n=1 Tax=Virgisporangium aurantiacum TaxID=175570 RepID=A0A8J3Z7V9_9ACTN|nr:BTAD domain-containing putative transcriptional regulator [Virgisporangium aurantiacum]GIJ59074.1 SARP family transcriptional regulator [Virgisporangium aurantiacum]